MDYEATDRYYSFGAVQCVRSNTRLFLTDDGLATDIPARAKKFRDNTEARIAATQAREEPAWMGFDWQQVPYFTVFDR